jgi:transglutaminase-like putative cysteine protease
MLNAFCAIDFASAAPIPAILMLRPRSGWGQWVCAERYDFEPRVPVVEYTDMFGNLCQRTVIPAGQSRLRSECTVEVPDAVDTDFAAAFVPPQQLPDAVLHYLLPSRYCPSDLLGELAGEATQGAAPGYGQVEAIRAWIQKHVEYRRGASTSSTTALDTANARNGVCRDFAHLGIALCRAMNIPARMVAGFSRELDEPDLHAWFEAYVGARWYAFDATEEKTSGHRIAIAYGRDAVDVALVTNFGPLQIARLSVKVETVLIAPANSAAPG